MGERSLNGLLFVGDPHLATRAPGFRKDDFAETVLAKLRWCVEYAQKEKLLVVLLGDLFHHPRDISNRLLVELIALLQEPAWAVAGNHDLSENALCDNDALAVLVTAGCVRLLDREGPIVKQINGATVIVGGTAWGQEIPESFDPSSHAQNEQAGDLFCGVGASPTYSRLESQARGRGAHATKGMYTFWVTHHDIQFPGEEFAGRVDCREIPGIDVVINGHIHRALPDVKSGQTTWMNPGNICRIKRSDATKDYKPGVLRFDISRDGWTSTRVEVPHLPFDEVFHPVVEGQPIEIGESMFIKELAALESARTGSGAGLQSFLDANLPQFPDAVAREIQLLATEVLSNASS